MYVVEEQQIGYNVCVLLNGITEVSIMLLLHVQEDNQVPISSRANSKLNEKI